MRRLLGTLFVFGAVSFLGCQQTQEADEEPDTTVIKEKETVVQPAEDQPDVQLDVKMKGEQGEAEGEVNVETK